MHPRFFLNYFLDIIFMLYLPFLTSISTPKKDAVALHISSLSCFSDGPHVLRLCTVVLFLSPKHKLQVVKKPSRCTDSQVQHVYVRIISDIVDDVCGSWHPMVPKRLVHFHWTAPTAKSLYSCIYLFLLSSWIGFQMPNEEFYTLNT